MSSIQIISVNQNQFNIYVADCGVIEETDEVWEDGIIALIVYTRKELQAFQRERLLDDDVLVWRDRII